MILKLIEKDSLKLEFLVFELVIRVRVTCRRQKLIGLDR